jgi:V8-like Glu-specific endopeptidase
MGFRMKISNILGLALSLSGCVVGTNDGSSDDNILGGTTDPGDPAVAAVRYMDATGNSYLCTGTLIAPKLLVSAGHCAVPGAYDVNFSEQPNLAAAIGTQGWITATAIVDPQYDGNTADGHDLSVILLSQAQSTTPIALGSAPAAGATVRAVGYGMDVIGDDGTGAGTKRQVTIQVDSVATHEIVTGQQGLGTCHGDSGGPLFDSSGTLVATTSYGDDADCDGATHDMRVDDNLPFLQQYLSLFDGGGGSSGSGSGSAGSGSSTSECDSDVNGQEVKCDGASCTCLIDGQQVGTCTASSAETACSIPGDCCGF